MDELGTTGRLLEVLSLLQARPRWSGPELADRLGVTVRTVRRDIDRLRGLGYPVLADTGSTGGYRLGAGGRSMPPLMLDRDEAVAVAVCLRSAATDTLAGGGEAAVRALGKLELLLPPTLRRHVGTIGSMTARLGGAGNPVSPDVLVAITRACRDSERLQVRYRDGRGHVTERTIDPFRVVSTARRWYLVARDRDRADWRTFRVDRIDDPPHDRPPRRDRGPAGPGGVRAGVDHDGAVPPPCRVELAAPLAELAELVPPTAGVLEPVDDDTTLLTTGADDLDLLAFHLLSLGVDFRVVETDAVRQHLAAAAERLANAVAARGRVGVVNPSNEDVTQSTATTEAEMRPQSVPVNVYEASEALVVVAPLPAVTAGDVCVEVRPGDPPTMRFWVVLDLGQVGQLGVDRGRLLVRVVARPTLSLTGLPDRPGAGCGRGRQRVVVGVVAARREHAQRRCEDDARCSPHRSDASRRMPLRPATPTMSTPAPAAITSHGKVTANAAHPTSPTTAASIPARGWRFRSVIAAALATA